MGIGSFLQRLIGPIFGVIDEVVQDKDEAARLKSQIQLALINNEAQMQGYLRDIVVAEAQGESWLQRNWRPMLMCVFGLIVANNYVLSPYIDALFGASVYLDLPDRIWDLLTLGVGGYIGGRTAEKVVKTYMEGRVQEAERSNTTDTP